MHKLWALVQASNGSKSDQLSAFVEFVGEFGTHFSSVTLMGTKLVRLNTRPVIP